MDVETPLSETSGLDGMDARNHFGEVRERKGSDEEALCAVGFPLRLCVFSWSIKNVITYCTGSVRFASRVLLEG